MQNWISVNDALPECGEQLLLCVSCGCIDVVYYYEDMDEPMFHKHLYDAYARFGVKFKFAMLSEFNKDVTHWMYITEIPV